MAVLASCRDQPRRLRQTGPPHRPRARRRTHPDPRGAAARTAIAVLRTCTQACSLDARFKAPLRRRGGAPCFVAPTQQLSVAVALLHLRRRQLAAQSSVERRVGLRQRVLPRDTIHGAARQRGSGGDAPQGRRQAASIPRDTPCEGRRGVALCAGRCCCAARSPHQVLVARPSCSAKSTPTSSPLGPADGSTPAAAVRALRGGDIASAARCAHANGKGGGRGERRRVRTSQRSPRSRTAPPASATSPTEKCATPPAEAAGGRDSLRSECVSRRAARPFAHDAAVRSGSRGARARVVLRRGVSARLLGRSGSCSSASCGVGALLQCGAGGTDRSRRLTLSQRRTRVRVAQQLAQPREVVALRAAALVAASAAPTSRLPREKCVANSRQAAVECDARIAAIVMADACTSFARARGGAGRST